MITHIVIHDVRERITGMATAAFIETIALFSPQK
jgi:hypothetical protein